MEIFLEKRGTFKNCRNKQYILARKKRQIYPEKDAFVNAIYRTFAQKKICKQIIN